MTQSEHPPILHVGPAPTSEELDDVAERAATVLDSGGTLIVPTDTVYGVAARIDRRAAIDALFDLKGRDHSNPLAVLVADAVQGRSLISADQLTASASAALERLMTHAWPGALTVVVPRDDRLGAIDLGGDPTTIGVRCPRSSIVREIASRVGPLVTTSANRSGSPTPSTASAAAGELAGNVAMVIDAGPCTERPSTVLDMTVQPFRILRVGSVDIASLGVDLGA